MTSQSIKRLVFLALFGLLPILSNIAAAQTKTNDAKPTGTQAAPLALNARARKSLAPDFKLNKTGTIFCAEAPLAASGIACVSSGLRAAEKFKPADVDFRSTEQRRRFERSGGDGGLSPRPAEKTAASDDQDNLTVDERFHWRAAVGQSLMFLAVQHGYAILGQAKTRRALKHGPFFKDYVDSVKSLHGWNDGGRFFTNYIAHPMQGSMTGFVYIQNSPKERKLEFAESPAYWRSRMKAMLWTAAWSTQFEIGPVSQASIGNVGLKGKQTWEDIVNTPTLGTAMLISEDAIDRYLIKGIERRNGNFYVKVFARMLLNPTRNFSNLLRFKAPWYRDRPAAQ